MGVLASPAAERQPGPKSSLGDVVRSVLTQGLSRLLEHDWRLRAAMGEAASHDIHQARVATRRLRSDLRTFDAVLDPTWVSHVRLDLKWLGSALGEVRDADVLTGRLAGAPEEMSVQLDAQRAKAAERLSAVLANDRYVLLLDRLHAATNSPPFVLGEDGIRQEDKAVRVLPALVGRPMACIASSGPKVRARCIGRTSAPHPNQGKTTSLRGGGGDSRHGQGGPADSKICRRPPDAPRRTPRCSHRGILAPRAGSPRPLPRRRLRGRTTGGRAATSPAQASAPLAPKVGAARAADAPSLDGLSRSIRHQRPRTVCKSRTCSCVCSSKGRRASATSANPRSMASPNRCPVALQLAFFESKVSGKCLAASGDLDSRDGSGRSAA